MSDEVTASFDGSPISAPAGASVAAALLASGRTGWRTTRSGRPRGLFCGIGVCFDCLVDIDGESGHRACMIPLAEGMDIRSAGSRAPGERREGGEHPAAEASPASNAGGGTIPEEGRNDR
ncbi:(2Fe-2S)-binding protein [Brevibacterium metallidurans]|uniref:2Fe-2S iron-sulfur cluster binding domain-containing protein n=1 Tax=Brevibacterium metallidurans TaxID=1482676 RepID=A0ABN0SQ93_9MICO